MKLNKYFPFAIIVICLMFATFLAPSAQADLLNTDEVFTGGNLHVFGKNAGYNADSYTVPLEQRVGEIIQMVLSFIGTIFLILIIWSGFQWMTAGGNSDTITKARQRMINATIGLVIVLAAFSITYFITYNLINITDYQG